MRYFIILLLFYSCNSCTKGEPPITPTIGLTTGASDDFFLYLENDEGDSIPWRINSGRVVIENPSEITRLVVDGPSTLRVDDLFLSSPQLRVLNSGQDVSVVGNIESTQTTMTHIDVMSGSLSGEFSPHLGMVRLRLLGDHSVSVDAGDLPNTLEYLEVNHLTGKLPSELPSTFIAGGVSDVGGDYGLIRGEFPTRFKLSGNNQISTYTPGQVDFSLVSMRHFQHDGTPGEGLSSNEVDNLLVDLSKSKWSGEKVLIISGAHNPRSPASTNAVTSLMAQGVTVQTPEE